MFRSRLRPGLETPACRGLSGLFPGPGIDPNRWAGTRSDTGRQTSQVNVVRPKGNRELALRLFLAITDRLLRATNITEALLKLVDASLGIDELLLSSEEGMGIRCHTN